MIASLPTLNACLNATATILLILGYRAIRRKDTLTHKRFMLAATLTSCAFLTSYLIYHAHVGSKKFTGTGPIRIAYFAILLTHTVLAAGIVPPILRLLFLAQRERFESHARLGRWVFPTWVYVSITGVVIYAFLYL